MDRRKIQRIIRETYQDVDTAIDRLLTSLENRANRVIVGVVEQLPNSANPAKVNQILAEFETKMLDGGILAEADNVGAVYLRIMRGVRDKFEEIIGRNVLDDIDAEIIKSVIEFQAEQVSNKVVGYAEELRVQLIANTITGAPIDAQALLLSKGRGTLAQVETDIRTSIQGMNGALTAKHAKKLGLEKFEYIGPDDKVTRPFCDRLLNRRNPPVYTAEEIKTLDNGQGLDVMNFKGGYNCRHEWVPVE